jgi:hypothetical protein
MAQNNQIPQYLFIFLSFFFLSFYLFYRNVVQKKVSCDMGLKEMYWYLENKLCLQTRHVKLKILFGPHIEFQKPKIYWCAVFYDTFLPSISSTFTLTFFVQNFGAKAETYLDKAVEKDIGTKNSYVKH